MSDILIKTGAGQSELRDRAVDLPRGARTLLVLVNGARNAEQLLTMVKGATVKDIDTLLQTGLVVLTPAVPAKTAANKRTAAVVESGPLRVKLQFNQLYDCLIELIPEQLGALKAFKYIRDTEKASTADELMVVARRFVDEVRKVKSDSAANMVQRALGMTH